MKVFDKYKGIALHERRIKKRNHQYWISRRIRAYLRCRNMQFWHTTCKYRRVIGQQYTRGIQSLISRCQRPRYSEFFDGIP